MATPAADHAGTIDGIYVANEASEPMMELRVATVIAGRGIVGDRYARRKGTYSVFRNSAREQGAREPGRQLTLVAAEGVEAALTGHGIKALPSLGDLRRNIVVRGIPAETLQAAVGHEIQIGDETRVFAHRSCVPCLYNERKSARPGLMEACWDCAGLNCEVLVGGEIRAGDAVVIGSEAQPERVDGGVQAPGFFERPSKRTRAQIHAAQRFSADRLPALLNSDPGGVVRAVTSFNSVGLQFFKRPKRFRRGEAIQDRFCTMVGIFILLVAFLMLVQKGETWYKESTALARWRRFFGH